MWRADRSRVRQAKVLLLHNLGKRPWLLYKSHDGKNRKDATISDVIQRENLWSLVNDRIWDMDMEKKKKVISRVS